MQNQKKIFQKEKKKESFSKENNLKERLQKSILCVEN